ncbi:hypothetical protein P171DRAFT_446919 [Karstenula rhodostoma CBS 690.94]|uniref:DUF7029 domain-containing protein n=1 Tax=Karstenula rhodostoma CBS 690.94 TaxID=1392251 RepID=A0A9P4PBR0_9PLEO|nr:hypothetical protein P171DRAFT_446919 [Karstenula rhodostoma CBS 690.94]
MARVVLLISLVLSWFFQNAHANVPGQLFYHEKSLGIRGRLAPDDHLDGMDHGAIPLVRTEHHHIGKRSAHLQLVVPRKDITLDWQFPDGNIRSFQYTHGNGSYVNLEPLQSHGLLLSRRQLCAEREDSRSVVNLDFRYNDTYKAAKESWQDPGLLFVVEDGSCHEGPNIRSVYRSEGMTFDDASLSMEISAENLSFGPYEAEAAHSVTIFTGSFASLKKRDPALRFYLTPRLKTGISEHLSKRENPLEDIENPLEDIENPLKGDGNPLAELEKEFKEVTLEGIADILDGLEKSGFSLNKSVSIDFDHNLNETTHIGKNRTYGAAENRVPILKSSGHGEIWPNLTLVNSYAKVHLDVRAVISFSIKGAADLLRDGGEDGFDASMKDIFKDSLTDFYVEVEATEDLAIRLQAELAGTLGFVGSCTAFLYPPEDMACSVGPLVSGDLFMWDLPAAGDPSGKSNKHKFSDIAGINGFGATVGAGLAVWSTISTSGIFNLYGLTPQSLLLAGALWARTGASLLSSTAPWSPYVTRSPYSLCKPTDIRCSTLPGIEVHVPKGSVAGYGRKNSEKFQSKFDGEVKWTKPNFQAKHLEWDGYIAIGPAMTLSFGAAYGGSSGSSTGAGVSVPGVGGDKRSEVGVAPFGNKSDGAAGIQSEKMSDIAPRASFKPAFKIGISAKAEIPGIEFKVSTKEDVDKKCEPGGGFKTAVGVEVDLRFGIYAGLDLPGGFQISTGWIKTGVKGFNGLIYHINLWKHCWDTTDTDFGRQQLGIEADIEDGLNKERNNLTAAWYDHEADQWPANSSSTTGKSNSTYSSAAEKWNSKYPSVTASKSRSKLPSATSKSSTTRPPSYYPEEQETSTVTVWASTATVWASTVTVWVEGTYSDGGPSTPGHSKSNSKLPSATSKSSTTRPPSYYPEEQETSTVTVWASTATVWASTVTVWVEGTYSDGGPSIPGHSKSNSKLPSATSRSSTTHPPSDYPQGLETSTVTVWASTVTVWVEGTYSDDGPSTPGQSKEPSTTDLPTEIYYILIPTPAPTTLRSSAVSTKST